MLTTTQIAKVAHEVNKAYCEAIGDLSQRAWDQSPAWQRESVLNGVEFHQTTNVTPEESHINWLEEKVREGWVYGEIKDAEKKTHPCVKPYAELPLEQRVKDHLFRSIVKHLTSLE